MPDFHVRDPRPRDWGDAIGALPPAMPPADGWRRLAAALPPARTPARATRGRRPVLAMVATALFATVIPLMHWRTAPIALPPLQRSADAVVTGNAPGDAAMRTGNAPVPAVIAAPGEATATVASAPAPRPAVVRAPRGDTPPPLDALYSESARLEAVLAQLPDNGTGNVAALVVSAELQDQVTHIDLALSQPALPDVTRAALWQQRVDTLRQLTGVEATQRGLVALNDAADTAIY